MAIPEWDAEFERILRAHLSLLEESEALPADTYLSNLGLDAVESIHLLLSIEEAYGVTTPDELLDEMFETAGTLWKVVQSLRGAAG
jgi:acyl carrier protein